MALPESWTQVPIKGIFKNRHGTPASGRITFSSKQVLVIDGEVIIPKTMSVTLDADGEIPAGFMLPATDDPDLNITTSAYLVHEIMDDGGGRETYSMFVEHDAVEIDLATVAPVVPPPELVSTIGPVGPSGAASFSSQLQDFANDPDTTVS